jgi:Na+-driven multidrug efflux pump
VLFNFLATATTPLLSKAMGTRNRQAAGEIVWQATGLALLLGTGVGLGLWRYGDAALELMGADGSQGQRMHDLALQYLLLRWVCWAQRVGRRRVSGVGALCSCAHLAAGAA